jgi:hypothetical protein
MKISDLIQQLEVLKAKHGDLPVRVQSLTHTWDPEPELRPRGKPTFVLLNP